MNFRSGGITERQTMEREQKKPLRALKANG